MRREQLKAFDHGDDLFPGYVVMRSYYPGDPYPGDEIAHSRPHPVEVRALAQPYGRYCDRPMDWRARLCGIAGAATIYAIVIAVALVTWKTVHPVPPTTSRALTVVDLAPLAAPPELLRDVAPGPEQIERQESKPEPSPDAVMPPPMIQLVPPSAAARKTNDPVPVVDPGPPAPETTAPRVIAAPAASRASNDAKPNWEGEILARLERFRRYPARARAGREEGTVYIRFTINRPGMILSSTIVQRSGSATLDQEALDTLKRAQPLPAIPPDRPDVVELTMPVEFYLAAR